MSKRKKKGRIGKMERKKNEEDEKTEELGRKEDLIISGLVKELCYGLLLDRNCHLSERYFTPHQECLTNNFFLHLRKKCS